MEPSQYVPSMLSLCEAFLESAKKLQALVLQLQSAVQMAGQDWLREKAAPMRIGLRYGRVE